MNMKTRIALLGPLSLGLGLVLFSPSFARVTASEPGSPASPANSKGPAAPDKPKYLIFWSESEKAGELAERVGMKGDGKTRLLGFGLPNATYELEAQLPNRIRSAFAAAREHGLAVMLHFDFHLAWKSRPDLWNWFDPHSPGYDPNNQYNVEWHGWNGPPNKVRYLNHGVLERQPPNMCFTSKRTRAEVTRIVSQVIGPVLREEIAKLQAESKEALFAGVLVGLEPGIDDYSQPEPERTKMMQEDGVPAGPLGYRALLDRGFTANHPPDDFRQALANIVQETVAFWCQQFVEAGIPTEKLYPHVAAPAPIEVMNAPIRTAFNQYSRPGWTTYAVGVLGQGFKPLYDELEKHGNPPWAGVEANAGMPGSVVDWETYLAWHYNHGCVLVGVNMGATGEDLPRRLWDSAFGKEAIAAYRKFLTRQPLAEKPISTVTPQIRIQDKMKQVRAGIERWQRNGKDPSAVGKLMEGAQPLANGGKLEPLEKLVDQALEMLGEAGPGMLPTTVHGASYSTDFPKAEPLISEGGRWITAGTPGVHWQETMCGFKGDQHVSSVSTIPGYAFGPAGPERFGDSLALLTGTWNPDQMAQATVRQVSPSGYPEVEIRLRTSPKDATGYEIMWSALGKNGSPYLAIATWNGPTSAPPHWTFLKELHGPDYGVATGDVVKAAIVGNTITAYKNGKELVRITDNTFSQGNPGFGFNEGPNGTYGISSFSASDVGIGADALAATPVDGYQDMESGANGEVLTPALMNASHHGGGTWSNDKGELWVSTAKPRDLPGPVSVGGTNHAAKGAGRCWMVHDDKSLNDVTCTLPDFCRKITIACYYTPGVTIPFANQFDTIVLSGNQGYAVLQTRNDDGKGPYFRAHSCTTGWKTTFSPGQIRVVSGKTYWVNLHFDAEEGKTYVAAFDPDSDFAQVGEVVVADAWLNSTGMRWIRFGRADNHGPNPTAKTQSYFEHILIDYTRGAFPLVPGHEAPKQ